MHKIRIMKQKTISNKDLIILESFIREYGLNTTLNELQLTPKQLSMLMGIGLMGVTTFGNISCSNQEKETKQEIVHKRNPLNVPDDVYENIQLKTKLLIQEIDRIENIHGRTVDDISFDPQLMVYLCYKYNFDLPLLISQARHETGLGFEGIGPKCNSLFSIGAYDNDPTRVKFDSQNSSIRNYIKVMKKHFLKDGLKSVDELLKPGNFINDDGNRYSSDPNYERKIKNTRDDLLSRIPELGKPFK